MAYGLGDDMEDLQKQNDRLRAEVEKLSKGLYDRIQNRSRYINLSAVETALDHIDFINGQLGEAVELLRESRKYAGVDWMVKTDNFLSKITKRIEGA